MRTLLAFGWGLLATAPLLAEAFRVAVASRARELLAAGPETSGRRSVDPCEPARRRTRRQRRDEAALEREVPLAADLVAVALSAGLTPYLALEVAAPFAPRRVAARFSAILSAVATGSTRLGTALEVEAAGAPPLRPLLAVLIASERLGAPAGPALTRLAAESRARARRAALARARTVPVRLLFPLVFLVLPAFLLLTVAPVLLAGVRR